MNNATYHGGSAHNSLSLSGHSGIDTGTCVRLPMVATPYRLCDVIGQPIGNTGSPNIAGIGDEVGLVVAGVAKLDVINRTGGTITYSRGMKVYRDDLAYSWGKIVSTIPSDAINATANAPFVGYVAEDLTIPTNNVGTSRVDVLFVNSKVIS